jgi:hypothetical protein
LIATVIALLGAEALPAPIHGDDRDLVGPEDLGVGNRPGGTGVGATVSELACVVALTTLLDADTLPDGSIALTLNRYVVEGSGWRTHAPCMGGRGTLPGATVDTASSVGPPLTRISWHTGLNSSAPAFQVS